MPPRDRKRTKAIVDLYLSGEKTLKQIGEVYGITRERVRQIVRAAGIEPATSKTLRRAHRRQLRTKPCSVCGTTIYKGTVCSRKCKGLRDRTWSKGKLILRLQELRQKLGRVPSQPDMNKYGPSHTTYVYHFGSIGEAQRQAGMTPNPQGFHGHNSRVRKVDGNAG